LQLVRAVYYRDDRYEEIDPLLLRPIDDLELSNFSQNALHEENLYYIGDLVCRTEEELLNSNNIGKKELSEIKSKLETRGLSLNARLKNWPPIPLVPEDDE
jgi:DNA-directed RNA polymerase subunit alpha